MGKVKIHARLATFLVTFTLALVIVTLFARPLISNVDVPPVAYPALTAPKPISNSDPARNFVDHKTQLVSLDFVRSTAYATLTLKRRDGEPKPDKVWIQIIFFAPDDAARKVRASAPVEVREPFALEDTKTLTVAVACPPCAGEVVPASNYYARTFVSTTPENLPREARTNFDIAAFDIADATPVLVQNKPATALRH